MDVNGTKFHLLEGRRDWRTVVAQTPIPPEHGFEWQQGADARGIAWDAEFGGIALLRRVPVLPRSPSRGSSREPKRGATSDTFGNIFWITGDGNEIRVQPRGGARAGRYFGGADLAPRREPSIPGEFGPVAAPEPAATTPRLRGIAATARHLMVVGTTDPPALLIFDLDAAGPPSLWCWPDDFRPWLMTATPDGGVAIVDFDETTSLARLWQLDGTLASAALSDPPHTAPPPDFTPVSGEGPAVGRDGACIGGGHVAPGTPIPATKPVGLAALPDGSLLLLDAGVSGAPARILRLRAGSLLSATPLDALLTSPGLGVDLVDVGGFAVAVDNVTPSARAEGYIYVITPEHAQAFEFTFSLDDDALSLEMSPRAFPTSGDAPQPLVTAGTDVLFQSGSEWFPLEEQPRYRYLPDAILSRGVPAAASAMVFDGKEPGCVWHRVVADACVPAGCEIQVRARAADDRDRLERTDWIGLHPLKRRGDGSELPFARPFGDAASEQLGTFETLIRSGEGRYLELEIKLVGDGRASPKIRALRVYYPRFSYLRRYLPAVYREDRAAADFLDRWLSNPEGILTTIEGRIAGAEALLDPATAPAEYLDWLGGWFDALLDPSWDEGRRRLFLKFAWLLYRWRGSPLGLLTFLRLATEERPDESIFDVLRSEAQAPIGMPSGFGLRIVENFELRRFPPVLLGDPTSNAPGWIGEAGKWRPNDGGAALHALFRDWLLTRYGPPREAGRAPNWSSTLALISAAWELDRALSRPAELGFSLVPPSNPKERADWRTFAAETFDFGYPDVASSDADPWREFLARRYLSIDALNTAHARAGSARWSSFSTVPLPAEHELPADGAPLNDFWDFVALALPIRRNAHRFTVLVPATPGEDPSLRALRLQRVETIVGVEKPAHTTFDVRPFWALFQVGSARVGLDTVLGESSRFLPMVLDSGYLREGFLAADHPLIADDRRVIGRDRLQGN